MQKTRSRPTPPAQLRENLETGDRYAVAAIRTEHATFPAWNRPVEVTLRDRGGVIDVVGITRPSTIDE